MITEIPVAGPGRSRSRNSQSPVQVNDVSSLHMVTAPHGATASLPITPRSFANGLYNPIKDASSPKYRT